jgi:DNA polymerase III delta prime subunit
MTANLNSAFIAKYAPRDLSEVVLADPRVEQSIQRYVSGGDMRPLILYGPYGTGKSTIARLLSREMIPDSWQIDVHYYNPMLAKNDPKTSKRVADSIRCRGFGRSGVKIIILEELDSFPDHLGRNLKCVIDEAADHVLFIATTNDLSALDGGHRSRAVRLHIVQASLERWMPRIKAICAAEGVPLPGNQALQKLLDDSKGDNRQFLSDLQSVCEGLRRTQDRECETASD